MHINIEEIIQQSPCKTVVFSHKQLKITDLSTGENQVFAPVIYQSCMNPEDIRIFELKLSLPSEHLLRIESHYGTWNIDLNHKQIEINDWEGKIHKTNCRKCENCGRCGW
jgi:hypothetical protein